MRGLAFILLIFNFYSCQKRTEEIYEIPKVIPVIPSVFSDDLDTQLKLMLDFVAVQQGHKDYHYFEIPESDDFEKIPQDPNNKLTPSKIMLGKKLFHETALSTLSLDDNHLKTYSCSSCHGAQSGFTSGNFQGIAEGGIDSFIDRRPDTTVTELRIYDVQPLKVPANMNMPWQKNVMWNGQFGAGAKNKGTEDKWKPGTHLFFNSLGFEGIETQAIAGLDAHRLISQSNDDKKLKFNDSIIKTNQEYIDLFSASFPLDSESISHVNAGLAIAAYERTLLSNRAPFQKWLKGDEKAMTENQKKGAILFFGKARCFECHSGPALNEMEFYAIGMPDLKERNDVIIKHSQEDANLGRASFTKKDEDNYKFKVPQLYNLKDHAALGHGNSFESILEVIKYKNKAEPLNQNVDPEQISEKFVKLNLSNDEMKFLADFISEGLYDDDMARYLPKSIPSGQCFPNNDLVSQSKYCSN
ncbi:MAG: cytochrome-c peroxidase [Halobacteriovoraceae bacterium]|nr:cytochrome-c peroxidase [Halobacteriovoraceae bacterium]